MRGANYIVDLFFSSFDNIFRPCYYNEILKLTKNKDLFLKHLVTITSCFLNVTFGPLLDAMIVRLHATARGELAARVER